MPIPSPKCPLRKVVYQEGVQPIRGELGSSGMEFGDCILSKCGWFVKEKFACSILVLARDITKELET